jgi:multiple sugar transport system permease protein
MSTGSTANGPRRKSGFTARLVNNRMAFIYIGLSIWFIISIFPFVWTFLTSIKRTVDAFAYPPLLIFKPTLNYYKILWLEEGFLENLKNSIIVTAGTVTISVSLGCLAGYGLARYRRPISFVLLMVALVFRALPHMTFVLPYFYLAQLTGLYDTHILLILVLVTINQPFTIWIMRSFFMEIPEELEEAAQVDGCSRFTAFTRVIMPIMGPGVATAAVFSLLLAYNDFLMARVLTGTQAVTLPVAISQFGTDNLKYWSISAAGAISITLPAVIVVLALQKLMVKGLTAGAVKG